MIKRMKAIDEADRRISRRIRDIRILAGISQTKLGDAIGVTFQQIQKYERGANRLSAGRLQRLAEVLRTPIQDFFDAAPIASEDPPEGRLQERKMRLLKNLRSIKSPEVKRCVERLLAVLADPNGENGDF